MADDSEKDEFDDDAYIKFLDETEEDWKVFAAQVGELIHRWSGVENLLCQTYLQAGSHAKSDHTLAAMIFHQPEAFRTKIDMVDTVVTYKLKLTFAILHSRQNNIFYVTWRQLRQRALDFLPNRNRVAHGLIIGEKTVEGNYLIHRPLGSVKWIKEGYVAKEKPVDLKKLKKWTSDFLELRMQLHDFNRALEKQDQKLLPKVKNPAAKPRRRGTKPSKS